MVGAAPLLSGWNVNYHSRPLIRIRGARERLIIIFFMFSSPLFLSVSFFPFCYNVRGEVPPTPRKYANVWHFEVIDWYWSLWSKWQFSITINHCLSHIQGRFRKWKIDLNTSCIIIIALIPCLRAGGSARSWECPPATKWRKCHRDKGRERGRKRQEWHTLPITGGLLESYRCPPPPISVPPSIAGSTLRPLPRR